MTVCGILRLDDEPADPQLVRSMLAATVVAGTTRWAFGDGPLAMAATGLEPLGPAPAVHVTDGIATVVHGRVDPPPPGDGPTPPPAARVTAAWRARGPAIFDELTGDWLIVLWEAGSRKLVLARSMNGTRRLLTWTDGRMLVFGTEFGQLAAAGVQARLNEAVLAEHLCQAASSPNATPVVGVERLAEGELFMVRPGGTPVRRVFDTLRGTEAEPIPVDLDSAAAGLRLRLEQGVEAALPSEGNAAVLVSGGVSSSVVTALARSRAAADEWPGKLVPAGMVFPGRRHDESRWLDELQRHLGLDILRFEPAAYDWEAWRRWTAATWDAPIRADAALLDHLVAALPGEGVTAALTGEGGDDWFAGRPRHWADLVRARHLGSVWRETPRGLRPTRMVRRVRMVWANGIRPLRNRQPLLHVPAWVNQAWLDRLGVRERVTEAEEADWAAARSHDHFHRWVWPVRRRLVAEAEAMQHRLNGHGIDWRHPLHDRRVVEYALGLHPSVLWSPERAKRVLRAAVADLLPTGIADRRDRARFDEALIDAIEGFGGPDALADHAMVKEGWVDLAPVREHWERVLARRRAGGEARPGEDVRVLWPVFAMAAWLDEVPVT